jgi:hypothetical protein
MSQTATVAQLQQRISHMQVTKLDGKRLPTLEALTPLFAGGTLRRGCTYTVQGSLQLALTLMSQASAEGIWCGVLGLPELGIEAAQEAGISLKRLVWIPAPEQHLLNALSGLIEAFGVILVGHCEVTPSQNATLLSRLREYQSTLITLNSWGNSEATLNVEHSRWTGLSEGFGMLRSRELIVASQDRGGLHRCTLRFERRRVQQVCSRPQLRAVN